MTSDSVQIIQLWLYLSEILSHMSYF